MAGAGGSTISGAAGAKTGGAPGTGGSTMSGTAGAKTGGAPGAGGSVSGSGGSPGGTAGAAGSGGSTPIKSAGCGKAAPLTAPTQQSVMIDSVARGYLVAPPASYDNNKPYALIFAYHGAGGTGAAFRPTVDFEAGTANQAIFVYPDGAGGIWDLKNNGSDAKLFDSILASMSANWCLDTGAIYAVGFSYGGWAATQMASARPTIVRAIVSIAGGGPQGSTSGDPPVAAMLIHGTNDGLEPIASGMSSRDHFVKINGCTTTSSATTPAPCVSYAGCKPKKSVLWCAHDGVHQVPAFTAAGMWAFFNSAR